MQVKAKRVLTAMGESLTTEAHDDCCCDAEEVCYVEISVPEGTVCDICGEEITDNEQEDDDAT